MSLNRNRNSLLYRKDQQATWMNIIHRAVVTDVNLDAGTINAKFEDMAFSTSLLMPLLGLSLPPKTSETEKNEFRASWGRYIPQVGDILLVGFDAKGEVYCLGYHAVLFDVFNQKDEDNADRGGISWGASSGKRLKPGDWDFKSARGASLYLGNKAKIASGPHSIDINKDDGNLSITSSLIKDNYGSSETRKGEVRRKIFPIDPNEKTLYNAFGQVAQESTDVVKRGFPDIEMCRTSMGDVIDETLYTPMVSTLGGTVVRKLESVKDPAGATDLYLKTIDDLGNYGVDANTAIMFQWNTAAATWNITNANMSITSSATYSVTSPSISLSAATSAVVTSPNIQLGSAAATEFLVKGTTFLSAMNSFFGPTGLQLAATTGGSAPDPTGATFQAFCVTLNALLIPFLSALSNMLSVKVKTE